MGYLKFSYLFLLLFVLVPLDSLLAKHIVGGEMYYECLGYTNGDPNSGSRTYRFYMRLYRDVDGGEPFDSQPGGTASATVTIYRGNDRFVIPTQILIAPKITPVEIETGNNCFVSPSTLKIEEGLYTFEDLDIPISNESYYIVYQRCCRTPALSNINEPGSSGATYFVELTPEAQQTGNSSPQFKPFEGFYICTGEPFTLDHSAVDPDGNRLEYSFCEPFLGGGPDNTNPFSTNGIVPDPDAAPPYESVDFITPTYTFDHPIGVASDFSIDPNTGLISGTPNISGQFVVGVCVREYDANDQLLSEVRRDFQFQASNCEKNIEISFDSDFTDNNGVPTVNACNPSNVALGNNSTQSDEVDNYFWEFDINGQTETFTEFSPVIDFGQPGTYSGRFVLSSTRGCVDTGQIKVQVIEAALADFETLSDLCLEDQVAFNNTSSVPTNINVSYRWDFGDGNSSTATSPDYGYATAGSYDVQLLAISDGICRDSVRQTIDFFPISRPLPISGILEQGCLPQQADFSVSDPLLNDQYTITWDFGDGTQANGLNATHTYTQMGTFTPTLRISSPGGCVLDTSLASIEMAVSPTADFSFSPTNPTSLDPVVTFSDLSQNASQWQWDFGGYGSSSEQNPVFTFPDSAGTYSIELLVTHSNGCTDATIKTINLKSIDDFYVPNAFSPNNDGINDEFKGFGPLGGKQNFELTIFSRWGDRVFYSTDPSEGWNGRKNNTGAFLPQGVYVYYLTFKNSDGEPIILKGLLNLLK